MERSIRLRLADAMGKRASAAFGSGKFRRARAYARLRWLIGGSVAWTEEYLGCICLETGEPKRALGHLERALADQPGDPRILANLVRCHIDLSSWDDAARIGKRLVLLGSLTWKESYRIGRGLVESGAGEEAALPWFEFAGAQAPDEEWPQVATAHCYRHLGEHQRAREIYERVQASGRDPYIRLQAIQGLSDTLAEEGYFRAALEHVEGILQEETNRRLLPAGELESLREFHSWLLDQEEQDRSEN